MKTFHHTAHKKMWDWLSNNPNASKEAYLRSFDSSNANIINGCYACSAGWINHDSCACPLLWGHDYCEWEDENCPEIAAPHEGLYARWCYLDPKYTTDRAQIARQIRDLPLNPDFDGEVV